MFDHVENLNQALLQAMDTYTSQTCFHVKRGKQFRAISYQRFQALTFRLAHYFRQQGISNGQRIAIIADNPLEWMVVYVACLLSGGVAVPLRAWLPQDMLYKMVKDSGAYLAVIQGEEQKPIIDEIGKGLPNLKTVLALQEFDNAHSEITPIASVFSHPTTDEEDQAIRTHAEQVDPHAPVLIYYKTGRTIGAVFDHAQRLAALRSMAEWFTLDDSDVAITTILSWSLSSLSAAIYYFLSGVAHVIDRSSDNIEDSLQQTTPTVILTTPSGPEAFYNQIMADIEKAPASRQALFQWALTTGKAYYEAGLSASKELREAYERADRIFFRQIRSKFGGTVRRLYSTGAPLQQQWVEFIEIIGGVQLLNIYSLTEAGGFPAMSQPNFHRPDSCGQVAPGFQIRIADDGEVLVRGQAVMRGYWNQPEETKKVFNTEGWLHTGDLGRFDQDGFLYLTGHKQPLIVLSNGRNIMPTQIEKALTVTPYIDQAVVFGQGRPYITALLYPDLSSIAAHIQEDEQADLPSITTNHTQVKSLVDQAVNEVNNRLDSWRQIKQYSFLEQPLCETDGELTAAQKPCRDVVAQHYASQIEAMYPQAIQLEKQDISQVQLELEELQELLEKQDILDAWLQDAGIGFLFDLARDKQVDAPSMVHICDTVAAISQIQNEEKPLSTALIVGNPASIVHHLSESEIQLQRYDHIRRMRQIIITLAKMVDGMILGYLVDPHGFVRGIYKLGESLPDESSNFLLGPQFRHHAALSRSCDAIVFFVPAGGRQVRVFADGNLVGRYTNGSWSAESIPEIDEAVAQLAQQENCDVELLQRILRCAFQMSEKNLGAIFVVGDADRIIEHSDPPEISPIASIVETNLASLSDKELINFAKQDGATVIDRSGQFRSCMVLLRPDASTQAEIGPGKGARHSSAAKMSAETQCLAITVSQDGPITIYNAGQRVLSI